MTYEEKFLKTASEKFGNKFDYSEVTYISSLKKVIIKCPVHGVFEQSPKNHLRSKSGCVKCLNNESGITTEEFVKRSIKLHGNKYDYTNSVYINARSKVIIVCPTHGEFEQVADAHLAGKGCSECRYEQLRNELKSNTESFILKAKKLHGDKYDYSKVIYGNNCSDKVIIICPIHGEIKITPTNHLRNSGCPECSITRISSTEEFVRRCIQTHSNRYDYSMVDYTTSEEKVEIVCSDHGSFFQSPSNHIHGDGCPKCSSNGTSKPEKEILDFVKSIYNGEVVENDRVVLDGREIDIYLPEINLGIELDGLYWHNQSNLEKRGVNPRKYHLEKTLDCVKKGIRLIHIFEDEWYDKRVHVENRLKHFLGIYNFKIGARQTEIRNLSAPIRREFLSRNHIQGPDGAAFSYGAYYKNKLVGIMSFCRPRISMGMKNSGIKNNMFELSRFATETGYQIFGLASKMFKHFVKSEDVDIVYTYSDLRWNKYHGTGTVYEKIGMKYVSSSSPSYFYIKDMKREYRFKYRKNVLADILEAFDPSKTEYENCLDNGLDRIFDNGCDKFEWRKEDGQL